MKPIKSLLVLAIVCAPVVASAQGYYRGRPTEPKLTGGFHNRVGHLTVGFGVGLGGMSVNGDSVDCGSCDFNPAAFEVDAHIGGVLTPRFALMLELQANGQVIDSDFYGDTTLTQGAAMIAGQVWLLPVLWLKGGIGFSNLQIDDGYFTDDLGNGVAVMGAVGVELLSARRFALELQGRIIEGTYNGGDDHVTSGTIGLGLNWY